MSRRRHNLPRELALTIDSLTPDGLGIAELENRRVHVRNALPGEIVASRILRRRKGLLFADGVAVQKPSIKRQPSACAHFPRCGGCNMHHLKHSEQLLLKQDYVAACLAANDVIPSQWMAPVSTDRLGYRTKARLGVRKLGDEVLVGFRESFSNRVARIQACQTLTPRLAALLPALRELIGRLSCAEKIPQIEFAQGSNDIAVFVRHLEPLTQQDMTHLKAFAYAHAVQLLTQSGGYETLRCVQGEPVATLTYTLPEHGLCMGFHPTQFTQVNQSMNRRLIQSALALFGDVHGRTVLDLFCGIGNFTLPLARSGARVFGVEVARDAVEQAVANAALNGLSDRVEFSVIDLYQSDLPIPQAVDAVLLDPPRSGAGPNFAVWLNALLRTQCHTIVYVSCNPVSFASDAGCLREHGFELANVGIFDMFPHTGHVETMGRFVRRTVC